MQLKKYFLKHFLHNKNTLIDYDSRKEDIFEITSAMADNKFADYISDCLNYNNFYYCFFNIYFIEMVLPYLPDNAIFHNCTFEFDIDNKALILSMPLLNYKFYNCTFYIQNYKKVIENIKQVDERFTYITALKLMSRHGSKIINNSYMEHIIKKNKKNLKNINKFQLNGMLYKNLDLRNVNLPDDNNFFQYAASHIIENVILPKIDFNKYNVWNISFKHVSFDENSNLTSEMLSHGLYNCKLPIINFKTFKHNYINARACTYHEKTIFPDDINFFIRNNFTECYLPEYNYSNFNAKIDTFEKCIFHKDAILPDVLLKSENIDYINHINHVPSKYLRYCIEIGSIKDYKRFLFAYKDNLTDYETFIVYNKYKKPL